MRRKKPQNKIIIMSLILLLALTVSYASFNTKINLKAKGSIKETDESCFTVTDNGDGTGTITDYDISCGLKVKIPNEINNLKITKIGNNNAYTSKLFAYRNIEVLIFPDTLTYIGTASCIKLKTKSIIIPDKVKTIAEHAFAWSQYIEDITLPEGLETIGTGAFEANNLTYLKIPSTVKNLQNTIASANFLQGDNAFIYAKDENGNTDKTKLISFGDRKRSEVIVPNNVKIIGASAFVSNIYINHVTLPDSVTQINETAFWSMDNLKTVDIGSGITQINSNAFKDLPNLQTININRKENAIEGAPWGNSNAKVNWTGAY